MRNDRDFNTCALWEASHENSLSCWEWLGHHIPVRGIHPSIVPGIDQKNRRFDHIVQAQPGLFKNAANVGQTLAGCRLDRLVDEVMGGGVERDLA